MFGYFLPFCIVSWWQDAVNLVVFCHVFAMYLPRKKAAVGPRLLGLHVRVLEYDNDGDNDNDGDRMIAVI